MDKFPDELSKINCLKIIEEKQKLMLKNIRAEFTEKIYKALENCDKDIILEFNDKMFSEHKITITEELLDKFGELYLVTVNDHNTIIKYTTNKKEIPTTLKKIKIKLYEN